MKVENKLTIVALIVAAASLSGVVFANSSVHQSSATSLQNTDGSVALLSALGQPEASLSTSLESESGESPQINFYVDGQKIPTDKPGVTPINQITPEGNQINGHVVNSGNGGTSSVNINSVDQHASTSVTTTVTPGDATNTNQTTTVTTFSNSFNNLNSNSFNMNNNINSTTTFSNGQVQQSP